MEERKIKVDWCWRYRRLVVRTPALLLALVLMSGCTSDLATITYEQVGVCKFYYYSFDDKETGHTEPAENGVSYPNQYYAVFRINSIDNTGSKNTFYFDPSKLVVRGGFNVDMQLTQNMNEALSAQGSPTQASSVSPGQQPTFKSLVVATVTSDSTVPSDLSFSLDYKRTSNDPGIIFSRSGGSSLDPKQVVPACEKLPGPSQH
jgi:hypothetical protein